MRVLELATVVFLALRAGACFAPAGWGVRARLAPTVAAALATVAHVVFEGWRWQMLPVYIVTGVLVLLDVGRSAIRAPEAERHLGRGLVGLVGAGLLAAAPTFIPMPRLPEPTGTAPRVAVMDGEVVDADRADRALPVRLWFPTTDSTNGPRARWLADSDVRLPLLATRAGLPSWFLSHARLIRGNAITGDQPSTWSSDNSWPVVVFSHGRAGFKEQNTYLAEALAANGYLVIAPDHTAGAFAAALDNGSVVEFDPKLFGDGLEPDAQDTAVQAIGDAWAADASAVLNALAAGDINSGPGPISIERVIAVGHSTGAGAMFEFCHRDSRCDGAVGLDGWMLPTSEQALNDGLDVPVLGLFGDPSFNFFEAINHERFDAMAAATAARGHLTRDVMLVGADHLDFTDGAMLSPWGHLLGQDTGPIDAHRAFELISAEVVWFANQVAVPADVGETPAPTDSYPTPPEADEMQPWSAR